MLHNNPSIAAIFPMNDSIIKANNLDSIQKDQNIFVVYEISTYIYMCIYTNSVYIQTHILVFVHEEERKTFSAWLFDINLFQNCTEAQGLNYPKTNKEQTHSEVAHNLLPIYASLPKFKRLKCQIILIILMTTTKDCRAVRN